VALWHGQLSQRGLSTSSGSEQSPQGDLLGVLVPIDPSAVRTTAALGQGFGDPHADQHFLQDSDQLVGLGQMQTDPARQPGRHARGRTPHRPRVRCGRGCPR
jgi:hypothetical protein